MVILSVQVQASEWQPFTHLESQSYSEAFSVYGAFNELDSRLSDGDEAFTHNLFEAGVARGPWLVSLFSRYDYHLSFLPATAELAHRGENDLPVDANREYQLGLHANHISTHGLKLGHTFTPLPGLRIDGALSYLHGQALVVGTASGNVLTDDQQSFTGDADVDYLYSTDVILHRRVPEPDGYGYAVDLAATWQITEALRLKVATQDLVNSIYWRDAPFTRAHLTSSTVDFDNAGFINTTPLLSGVEGKKDYRQQLPVRTRVAMDYDFTRSVKLEAEFFNIDSVNLYRVGFSLPIAMTRLGLSYETTARALTLRAEHRWFQMSLGLDDLDYKKARYLQFAASVNLHF